MAIMINFQFLTQRGSEGLTFWLCAYVQNCSQFILRVIFLIFTVLSVYFCHSVKTTTSGASSMERSGGGEVKGRRASLQLRLWNLNSTEQSYFRQSGRSGNERECKPTLKNKCHGNDVIASVISAYQHFASTFSTRYSNCKDVVASNFSRPAARAPRRPCLQAQ